MRIPLVVVMVAAAGLSVNAAPKQKANKVSSASSSTNTSTPSDPGSTTVLNVWAGDMQNWFFVDDDSGLPCGTPNCELTTEPSPLGTGSAILAIDPNGDRPVRPTFLSETVLAKGTLLSKITALTYYTKAMVYEVEEAPMLAIAIDFDLGDGHDAAQGRLVFAPADQGTSIPLLEWQKWDAIDGRTARWYFTDTPPGHAVNPCTASATCTLGDVLAMFPRAGLHKVFGAIVLQPGNRGTYSVGHVDGLTTTVAGVGTTIVNFDSAQPGTGGQVDGGDTTDGSQGTCYCSRHKHVIGVGHDSHGNGYGYGHSCR